ncbi:hypothetical protein RHMOL_Rhmol03G0189800 [Rhododendron molle]|uniref:Uncharacterized protein n=1 Tax=Rhododendron molle TaxID=49168 RepID=A0ACC0PFS4_RHOML|nr:hypothetical protein RHMOL_Rhmol03G0189800 [Rhododendron molle]
MFDDFSMYQQEVEATYTIQGSFFYIFNFYARAHCRCCSWYIVNSTLGIFQAPFSHDSVYFLYEFVSLFDYNLPAAVIVAQKETWRRRAIWKRVQDFHALTGLPVTSPIISLVVGSEEKALQASWYLLISGFHVTAIRPPTVPPNSCRLRVTLSAAHTLDDLKKLTAALSECINFRDMSVRSTNGHARL